MCLIFNKFSMTNSNVSSFLQIDFEDFELCIAFVSGLLETNMCPVFAKFIEARSIVCLFGVTFADISYITD